jgi:hypothetical protein
MNRILRALLLTLPLFNGALLTAAERIYLPAYKGVFPANESNHHGILPDGVTIHYYSNGAVTWTINAPAAGKYRLKVTASCSKADDGFAEFTVTVNGKDAGKPVPLKTTERADYELEVTLPEGETKIAIAFTNDKCVPGEYDRNLFVHKAALMAP